MSNPLQAAQTAFDALDAATQQTLKDAATAAMNGNGYDKQMAELVKEHGDAVWAAYTSSEVMAQVIKTSPSYSLDSRFKHVAKVALNADETVRPWVLVNLFGQLPRFRKWDDNPDAFAKVVVRAGPGHREAVRHVLSEGKGGKHRAALYELLRKNTEEADFEVLLAGMTDSTQAVRRACGSILIGELVEGFNRMQHLLSSKKKAGRLGVAESIILLSKSSRETVSAVALPKLQETLAKEKSPDVIKTLEKAITVLGGTPQRPAPVVEAATGDSAEALLAGQRKGKPPKFIDLAALPPLKDKAGTALSENALKALIGRLKNEGPEAEDRDDLAPQVRAMLDDASAEAWGEAIWTMWRKSGESASHKWALFQLAVMGGAGFVDTTGPTLNDMSYGGGSARAAWHLEVYRRMNTPQTLGWLLHWAWYGTSGSLSYRAKRNLELEAKAQGVTRGQLLSKVPPFAGSGGFKRFMVSGVAAGGAPVLGTLDYGPRQLSVVLDGSGKVMVEQPGGKRTASAPKPVATDDPRKAATAVNELKKIKAGLKVDLKRATELLEGTLVTQRSWSWAVVRDQLAPHPVMGPLLGGLALRAGDQVVRLSEDRKGALDVGGEAVTLADDVEVRLAHPVEMDAKALEAWQALLPSQPFDQLQRTIYSLPGDFDGDFEVESTFQLKPRKFVRTLEDGPWIEGPREDMGCVGDARLICPRGRLWAHLEHSGYYHSYLDGADPIEARRLYFYNFDGMVDAQVVPKAFLSEAIYTLRSLGGQVNNVVEG
ncbi:MAG: DUF4132 domain-containing protein [Bradymonadia bacterium]